MPTYWERLRAKAQSLDVGKSTQHSRLHIKRLANRSLRSDMSFQAGFYGEKG